MKLLRGRPFSKGQSGNPGGRPKELREVTELARSAAPEAVKALVNIMNDSEAPPTARIAAATAILDRGFGRPAQSVDVSGAVVVHDLTRLTDAQLDELERLVAIIALPPPTQGQEVEYPD
jgi:hypothetical protein